METKIKTLGKYEVMFSDITHEEIRLLKYIFGLNETIPRALRHSGFEKKTIYDFLGKVHDSLLNAVRE